MCGRYANWEDPAVQAAYFQAKWTAKRWQATWNAAPTQRQLVVRRVEGERILTPLTWGWQRRGTSGLLVNARGEEAWDKPTWAQALRTHRCVVPMTAFYEWRQPENQPYAFVSEPPGLLAVAGLWREEPEEGSFVLLTAVANAVVAPVHHRMACVLDAAGVATWLEPASSPEQLRALVAPFPAERMRSFPVSRRLNHVRHDDATLIVPEAGPQQQWLFPPQA